MVASLRSVPAMLFAVVVATGTVRAAEIVPRVSLGVVYSDNIRLAPPGQEESDLVGLVQPGVRIRADGQRYDFSLDYQLQALFYNDQEDADATYSIGNSSLVLKVVPEHLFVTADAAITQVVIDPENAIPPSNLPVTGNRQDQARFSVTPAWRQQLLGGDLLLSSTVGKILFEEDNFRDIDYLLFNNSLLGPQKDKGLTWGFTHEYASYDYGTLAIKRHAVDLSLYAELGSGWAPFARVGAESDFQQPTESNLDYFTWSAGLRRSTELSTFEASYGDRSFGNNWSLVAERRFGGSAENLVRASYREAATPPPAVRSLQFPTDDLLTDPGLPDVEAPPLLPFQLQQSFLNKRGDLILTKGWVRSTLTLRLFWWDAKSVPLGTDESEVNDSRQQTGISTRLEYRLGPRLSALGFLTYSNRDFKRDGVVSSSDVLINGRLGLNYQVGRNGSVRFWVSTFRRQDVEGDAAFNPYDQNVVGILFTQSFQ